MKLYYYCICVPLCIALFSRNMLYIPVLLLNKFSFIHVYGIYIIVSLKSYAIK